MAISRAEIEEKVTDVLENALGADRDDVVATATLTEDLGAESIDFLDIQFQLEKKFSTPEKPFKIEQGELFPENMMSNPDYVKDGKVHRKAHARVIRDGIPVFDGRMSTLRRFQEEVEEVRTNFECGIRLGEFNAYQEGDVIECYKLEKVPQTL